MSLPQNNTLRCLAVHATLVWQQEHAEEELLQATKSHPQHASFLQTRTDATHIEPLYGSAGRATDTSVSAMARGPTGLTTVFTGAMAIRAGAIFSPCNAQHLCQASADECPSITFHRSRHSCIPGFQNLQDDYFNRTQGRYFIRCEQGQLP